MISITLPDGSGSGWLALSPPELSKPPTLRVRNKIYSERGATGREGRRPSDPTCNLGLDWDAELMLADVAVLRAALAAYQAEPIVAPCWPLQVTGAAYSYGVTPQAGYMIAWNEDGTYQFFTGAVTSPTSWDWIAPAIYGYFSETPKTTAKTDEAVRYSFKLDEDSPAAWALGPFPTAPNASGPALGGYTPPGFPYDLDWAQSPETGAAGVVLTRDEVGPGRQKLETFFPNLAERVVRGQLTVTDPWPLLSWWNAVAGPVQSHWVSTWLSAGQLAADAAVGATTISVLNPSGIAANVVLAFHVITSNADQVFYRKVSAIDIPAAAIISPTLLNGGFETAGSGHPFANWTEIVGGASTVSRDTVEHQGGSASCRMDIDASNSGAFIAQTVLTVGKRYRVSFRAAPTNAPGISMYVSCGAFYQIIDLPPGWATYGLEFTALDATFFLARNFAPSASIWFDDVTVSCIDPPTVTLSAALPIACPAAQTNVCLAMLGRHVSDTLEISYVAPGHFTARLDWRELAAEYSPAAGETRGTTIGRKAGRPYLLEISSEQPVAEVLAYYTDWSTGITVGGQPYTAVQMDVGERKRSVDLSDQQLTITLPWITGSPLAHFLPGQSFRRLFAKLFYVPIAADGTVGTPVQDWYGEIIDCEYEGPKMTITAGGPFKAFDVLVPSDAFCKDCNAHLFDTRCGVSKADWTVTASVVSSSGATLVVGTASRPGGAMTPLQADGALKLGTLKWVDSGVTKLVGIYASSYAAGNYTLTLREPTTITASTSVTIIPGCDLQLLGGCARYSGKFRGFPFIPARAPQFIVPQQTTTTGKK